PGTEIACGSDGNALSAAVAGADSYQWSVESSDGQWVINSGATMSSILYTSGGPNSSATFTLTVVKDGCTQTCEYQVSTCKDDTEKPGEDPGSDPGEDPGEDPGDNPGEEPGEDPNEDPDGPGGGQDCSDCLETEIVRVDQDGGCRTYRME